MLVKGPQCDNLLAWPITQSRLHVLFDIILPVGTVISFPCDLDPKLAVQTYAAMISSTKTRETYCENDKQMYQNNFVEEMQNSHYI